MTKKEVFIYLFILKHGLLEPQSLAMEEEDQALPWWADKIVCFLAYGHHDAHDSELFKKWMLLEPLKNPNLIIFVSKSLNLIFALNCGLLP